MKYLLILLLFASTGLLAQQPDSLCIRINFLYGSRPLKEYKDSEAPYFGGIHGGHVTIEVDSMDYGFNPAGTFHVFNHKKDCHSMYAQKSTHGKPAYSTGWKYATIYIPVTKEQRDKIKTILNGYVAQTPYDYAFFGMRCAASAHEVLAQIGILPVKPQGWYVRKSFYPQKLRRRLLELAEKNKYKVVRQEGRKTRKWEKD